MQLRRRGSCAWDKCAPVGSWSCSSSFFTSILAAVFTAGVVWVAAIWVAQETLVVAALIGALSAQFFGFAIGFVKHDIGPGLYPAGGGSSIKDAPGDAESAGQKSKELCRRSIRVRRNVDGGDNKENLCGGHAAMAGPLPGMEWITVNPDSASPDRHHRQTGTPWRS